MKTALTIAGSDCSGGAGIQADLKTFAAHGVFGMSVITSVVAENTCRVLSIQDIKPPMIREQIAAVLEDIPPNAVKIGMLSGKEAMEAVAEGLSSYGLSHVVLDPVMVAKGGCSLMREDALDALIHRVLPLAEVVTPNLPEAEAILGREIHTREERKEAARAIYEMGVPHVLIKGGHLSDDQEAEDILFDGRDFHFFTAKRIPTKNTHGTGCTFSSAIAANLARETSVLQAVENAKAYVTTAITHALDLGHGHGPTHHFYELYQHLDFEDKGE